jgi:hypothetical protein
MLDAPAIEMTSCLAPAYFGILALLAVLGVGILFCAWKPWRGGISFSSGFEIPSRSSLHEAK